MGQFFLSLGASGFDRAGWTATAYTMEQLDNADIPSQTFVARIRDLLRLASELSTVLGDMIQESNFNPELARHRQWIEDAKGNIEKYRSGLLSGALAKDATDVSFWSNKLFSAYKYLSDVELPSRSQDRMIALAVDVNDAARSIHGDIHTFNPKNLEIMNAALRAFKE